jgi:hypothetical protein
MNKVCYILTLVALFASNVIFSQSSGGYPVDLNPYNPGGSSGGIIVKPDTVLPINPLSLEEELVIQCYKETNQLTLSCNADEHVNVLIYELTSGIKHTSTINMLAGEIYTIPTPWPAGFYTIRLTLTDGTMLEGDFVIR